MALSVSWYCQFHGSVSFIILPVSWYCQFHNTASFMVLSVLWHCQFHDTASFMVLPVSWYCQFHDTFASIVLLNQDEMSGTMVTGYQNTFPKITDRISSPNVSYVKTR